MLRYPKVRWLSENPHSGYLLSTELNRSDLSRVPSHVSRLRRPSKAFGSSKQVGTAQCGRGYTLMFCSEVSLRHPSEEQTVSLAELRRFLSPQFSALPLGRTPARTLPTRTRTPLARSEADKLAAISSSAPPPRTRFRASAFRSRADAHVRRRCARTHVRSPLAAQPQALRHTRTFCQPQSRRSILVVY